MADANLGERVVQLQPNAGNGLSAESLPQIQVDVNMDVNANTGPAPPAGGVDAGAVEAGGVGGQGRVGPAGAGTRVIGGGVASQFQLMHPRRQPYVRPEVSARANLRVDPPKVLLNGSNTDSWKLAVNPYLIFTGVRQFITSIEEPEPDCPSHRLWEKDKMDNVAVMLSLIEPTYQSRFSECTTARQVWEMAISESSSLMVRVKNIIRQWLSFDPEAMTPRDFVNEWNATLQSFAQCGNRWNVESQLAMVTHNFPPSMNHIRNSLSTSHFDSIQEAMERLKDLLESHQSPNDHRRTQSQPVMSARAQPYPTRGRGGNRGSRGGGANRGGRGGSIGRGGSNQTASGSGGGQANASGPPTCHECGQIGHFRPGCPQLNRHKRPINVGQQANRVPRMKTNQSPSGNVSSAASSSANKNFSAYLLLWILDSGASRHCSFNQNLFINYRLLKEDYFVRVASGQVLRVLGIGNINLALPNGGVLNIKGVWHVPDLKENVLSIFRLAIVGFSVTFFFDKARVYDMDSKCLFTIRARGGIYSLFTGSCVDAVFAVRFSEKTSKAMLWHLRLGHLNIDQLRIILNRMGIKCPASLECVTCLKGKIASKPHNRSTERSTQVLELIHSDICGPVHIKSSAIQYFVTFIDDYSRMVFVYGLIHRSEVFDAFCQFKSLVENQTGQKIKKFRSDNALEYTSSKFSKLFEKEGIIPVPTVSHTPKQNGIAERMNRTLNDSARCMLIHSGLPLSLWFEAVRHAAYVRNRCPSKSLPDNAIPHELWSGKSVDYSKFHVFGSNCIMKIRGQNLNKMEARGKEMIFIGHTQHASNYWLCDPNNRFEKQKGRDVCLLEDAVPRICTNEILSFEDELDQGEQFPINKNDVEITSPLRFPSPSDKDGDDEDDCLSFLPPPLSSNSSSTPARLGGAEEPGEDLMLESASAAPSTSKKIETNVSKPAPNPNIRKLRSNSSVGQSDKDSQISQIQCPPLENSSNSSDSVNEPHCWKRLGSRLARLNAVTVCNEQMNTEGLKFETVMARQDANKWYEAMEKEINTLTELESFTLVERPKYRSVISNTWVYALKLKTDGSIDRYKARLVAHGFRQRPGLDYNETTAPVARSSSVKVMLVIAHYLKLEVHQFDVTAAFINAQIDVDIYMEQPKGFRSTEHPDHVWKLNKGLYGLKQAGNLWYKMLVNILTKDLGLKQLYKDRCMFVHSDPDDYLLLLVYVDDILIMSKKPESKCRIVERMESEFGFVNRGTINQFLGMEVNFDPIRGFAMSQKLLIKSILDKTGMTDCKTIKTPLVPKEAIWPTGQDDIPVNSTKYREVIGMLSYLATHTRPDITHAVSKLAQFQVNPCERHMNCIKHLVRYVKGTVDVKLWLDASEGLKLKVYTDASYGTNVPDFSSTTGYVAMLGKAVIEWGSKKQTETVSSTANAELIAAHKGQKHLRYFELFLSELAVPDLIKEHPTLYCDNKAVNDMCSEKNLSVQMRHIEIKYHETLQQFTDKDRLLQFVGTADQRADGLTKILPVPGCAKMREELNLLE